MREVKTVDEMNLVVTQMFGAAASVISISLWRMPTSEADKIPIIGMTKDEFTTINNHCICIDITEDLRVYSCGGAPFKIKIKN